MYRAVRMKHARAFDFLTHQLKRFARKDCLCGKQGKAWRTLSTADTVKTVDRVSLGLMALGIGPGDRVAIAADNCTF